MTLSVPSCFAAATSASIPPLAAAVVAVAQALPDGWAPPPPPPPPPPLLTQPAVVRASNAATAAVIRRRAGTVGMSGNVAPGSDNPRSRRDHGCVGSPPLGRPGHRQHVQRGVELLQRQLPVLPWPRSSTTSRIVRRSFSDCFAIDAASS